MAFLSGLATMTYWPACLWCFALTFASAVFPWISAEVIVLALPALAGSTRALGGLVLVATAGQMTGKCFVYAAGRGGTRALRLVRRISLLESWRDRLRQSPWHAMGIIFLSSSVGIPPFFLITACAGAAKMNFVRFLIAGTAGRLIRFGIVAALPHYVAGWMK
jgi:membrane protein YqaA with SNARE-associated domain